MIEYKKDYSNIITFILGIPFVLAFIHFIYYLLTKITILVANGLFNADWADKFWLVYLFVFIVGLLLSGANYRR